ncbi:MAG: ABC transporter permease subunit [Mycetocola sp.]
MSVVTDTSPRPDGAPSTVSVPPPRRFRSPRTWARITTLVLLAVLDAVSVLALYVLLVKEEWLLFGIVTAVTIALNLIYLLRGLLPLKYLAPGVLFLLVFQVFVIGYTGYISLTNYGTGHNSTKDDAVSALIQSAQTRVPDSAAYPVTILEQLGEYSFLVTDPDGQVLHGSAENPLEPVQSDGTTLDGYRTLTFADIIGAQEQVAALSVPVSTDPNDGSLRTPDGSTAYLYTSSLIYDEQAGTMTDATTGVVYSDIGTGAFTDPGGSELMPGWSIVVGTDNYTRAISDESIRGPLIGVTLWTFVFAAVSVLSSFALGLFLALVFNHPRMKGVRFYRVLMILPYAFPAFLGALVWSGLLNQDFGFVNDVFFGGAPIPWLTNEWLAKVSVLLVNLWLGYPYMFLVCTGALQSIPEELTEAATVDGARPWAVFRLIKLPLLLVSLAPLLIASFAFNFNNFNLIYLLTGGGPRDAAADLNVGATDILISMVYKVAFVGADRDYGLASAFSILIFVVVSLVAVISFRRTKALEELN